MFWDPVDDPCGTCENPNMIRKGFNLPEECCSSCYHNSCEDKENVQQQLNNSPLKHENDLSLYSSISDRPISFRMRTLEDHDSNSQDSGYGASYVGETNKFYQFAKSVGVTPRNENSPKNCKMSFSSMDSMDAEFLELSDLESPLNENSTLPSDFNSLIGNNFPTKLATKEISPEFNLSHPKLLRSISLSLDGSTPNSSRVRSCLFKSNDIEIKSFKRPEPPIEELSPFQIKRSRFVDGTKGDNFLQKRPIFRKSYSVSEESIKYALHRSSTEPDLIGDFTISFCLPLISGRHQDLKSISPSTLAALMKGQFDESVTSFKVIDCRYPYEYSGGHINGSVNFYTKDEILEELLNVENVPSLCSDSSKRNILVFHCEFSSERGPNLCRFLRNSDRTRNKDVYPALHYPEIYLLEGGYKCFYEQYSELCVPMAYKPMNHPEHQSEFRHFRAKSKTFHGDRVRSNSKGNLKRLGFQ